MLAALIAGVAAAFLSNGTTCSGAPVATSTATTPKFNVTVCIASDQPVCGITYRLAATVTQGGTLRANSRTLAPGWDVSQGVEFPRDLSWPAFDGQGDWGATALDVKQPIPPGPKIKVATYSVTVLASRVATSYSLAFAPDAMIAIAGTAGCAAATEQPVAGSFTLKKKYAILYLTYPFIGSRLASLIGETPCLTRFFQSHISTTKKPHTNL